MITIPNVTTQQLAELLSGLKASGQGKITSSSDYSGIIEGRGVRASYSLTGDKLDINVQHGPWGVPHGMVEGHIQADLTRALTSMGWRQQ